MEIECVLYHVYHGGLLHQCITHRLVKNRDKHATLLVGSTGWHIGRAFPEMKESFVEHGLFNEVIFCDDLQGNYSLDLSAYSQIYNTADGQDNFGIYLSENKRNYFLFELKVDAFGFRVNHKNICRWLNPVDPEYSALLDSHKVITGESDLITPILYPQSSNPFRKKTEIFDFYNEVENIPDKESILRAFGVSDKKSLFTGNYDIFSPPSTGGIGSYERVSQNGKYIVNDLYRETNQLIFDYYAPFAKGNLVIKPHPSTPIDGSDYNTDLVLPPYFTTEYFQLVENARFNTLIGVISNALSTLRKHCADEVNISPKIYFNFNFIHRLYVALSVFKELALPPRIACTEGIDKDFAADFAKHVFNTKLAGRGPVVANLTANFEHEIPVKIEKTQIKPKIYCNLEPETVYFTCKDTKIRSKIAGFKLTKDLDYAGININAEGSHEKCQKSRHWLLSALVRSG